MAGTYTVRNKGIAPLIIIDGIVLFCALFASLILREGGELSLTFVSLHLIPFSVIFAISVVVFFIEGLYDRGLVASFKELVPRIVRAQIVNAMLAIILFYVVPDYSIAPKITLIVYVIVSILGLVGIRLVYLRHISGRGAIPALLIAESKEASELIAATLHTQRSGMYFAEHILPSAGELNERIKQAVARHKPRVIVIDEFHPAVIQAMPHFYEYVFSDTRFVDIRIVYEAVFNRIPLALVHHGWFIENIAFSSHYAYDTIKRLIDVILSVVLLIPTLCIFPFVWLAMKIEGKGPFFIAQKRIGQHGKRITLYKIRSMHTSDAGKWVVPGDSRITRIGKFIRKTRIDELPQLFSVIKGDISLIGPRPDLELLGETIEKELPFYSVRYLIKPGLSGWAQVKQDTPPQSLEETRLRLAYDLYYVKNRSLILDTAIVLKTIHTLISRKGM